MGWFIRKCKVVIKSLKENGIRYTVNYSIEKMVVKIVKTSEILNVINRPFHYIAKVFGSGLIEIITVRTKDKKYMGGVIYYVYFFGHQIYPIKRLERKGKWAKSEQPPMYLKVNRMSEYVALCVQQWVDVAQTIGADYFIICDDVKLKYHLLRNVLFPGKDIKFMRSMRRKLRHVSKTVADKKWEKAACAHMTSFYHADKRGVKNFWNIDADDTMLCLQPGRVAEALKIVQSVAEQHDISTISLDIWRSMTSGRHWSWGVSYVQNNVDFCRIFNENKDLSWLELTPGMEVNIDLYFNHLSKYFGIKVETFYVENMYFIHYGDFMNAPRLLAGVYFWHEGKLTFPIRKYIHKFRGTVNIADCIKVDIGAEEKEGNYFLNHNLSRVK